MDRAVLEARIVDRGKAFFKMIGSESPSIFNKNWWISKVMDWSMNNEDFKIQLFRFIDVLPYLTSEEMLVSHIQEYFSNEESVPGVLRLGAKSTGLAGKLGTNLLGKTIRKNLEMMALQFIIGGTVEETVKNLGRLRQKQGFAFTLDILGEATVSEAEADAYVKSYMDLLEGVGEAQGQWKTLGQASSASSSDLDWSVAPKLNVSIKPSALYAQADPADFEGTVVHMLERIKPVYRRVKDLGGFLCIDTEMRELRHVIIELYKRLRSDEEFAAYPHLGLAMQCYLNDSDGDLDHLLGWSRDTGLPISIRLVKGAYWDYEVVHARQNGWDVPVYTVKQESDLAFERFSEKILRNHELCHFAVASHNVRSVCAVIEMAKMLDVPKDRFEFQSLYGMAEPFRNALLKMTDQVRLYCPHGQLLPGMAYLIRRLLENTANESFLRQTFVDGVEMERLLEDPAQAIAGLQAQADQSGKASDSSLPRFHNAALADCAEQSVREGFVQALAQVKGQLGKTYALNINGQAVMTEDVIDSVNPAQPSQVVGKVCQAGTQEIGKAIEAAQKAFETWRNVPIQERAKYLTDAAKSLKRRIYEICAWQILEEGKQWRQAYNDVDEAIDFLNYYASEMLRLNEPQYLGHAPGEVNEYFYQPKGVAAVISPWNFPLAIACGMCSAAIVAGNCVVFKPSNLSPIMGHILVEAFQEAGLPDGVFNFTPGRGSVMGDFLVDHPAVSLIAFTGSMEVGLRIIERAGRTSPEQINVKKIICEMGGKNAIIIDDDADLDVAVPAVLDSAFTFQGQKCSACSRLIVLDTVYDRFMERLVDAARSWKIGPAEDPAYQMGPVIDSNAQKTILGYVDLAEQEGKILFQSDVPDQGYYVPLTIAEGFTPDDRLAQEEIFGPVLAVMRASDFDQALAWANSTRFALTGAVFSRSPEHLNQARKEFRVGNLYLNRGSTGALVERQPFGGFNMSGVGTKAGGPDYLLHFMDPRTVTENTLRRGFAPIRKEDEWV
ncbi:MAG: L-glutamate gamma-semialdehyde dehydrogenase [Phycisphaeraceae bacterium]|nr:L-glutamate gamma-semialdehyde dehydrogenase [Phycisphaeraceae bacterium]